MALGLLPLVLTLLLALNTQAHNSTEEVILRPLLSKAPLQPHFKDDKFQGEWFATGWAQNTYVTESISKVAKLSSTFVLNDDHSYNVTSLWFSKGSCVSYIDTVVPSDWPGQYVLHDVSRYKGLQNFTMKVVETDYNRYAVVFYEAIVGNKLYMECLLYGRKKLSSDVMQYFFTLARSLGFRREYINFTIPVAGCSIDYLD